MSGRVARSFAELGALMGVEPAPTQEPAAPADDGGDYRPIDWDEMREAWARRERIDALDSGFRAIGRALRTWADLLGPTGRQPRWSREEEYRFRCWVGEWASKNPGVLWDLWLDEAAGLSPADAADVWGDRHLARTQMGATWRSLLFEHAARGPDATGAAWSWSARKQPDARGFWVIRDGEIVDTRRYSPGLLGVGEGWAADWDAVERARRGATNIRVLRRLVGWANCPQGDITAGAYADARNAWVAAGGETIVPVRYDWGNCWIWFEAEWEELEPLPDEEPGEGWAVFARGSERLLRVVRATDEAAAVAAYRASGGTAPRVFAARVTDCEPEDERGLIPPAHLQEDNE